METQPCERKQTHCWKVLEQIDKHLTSFPVCFIHFQLENESAKTQSCKDQEQFRESKLCRECVGDSCQSCFVPRT